MKAMLEQILYDKQLNRDSFVLLMKLKTDTARNFEGF